MAVKVLPKGKMNGYQPYTQTVHRFAVVGVSQWSHWAAHDSYKPADDRHELVYSVIEENPGITAVGITHKTGKSRGFVVGVLNSMDDYGLLLWEDDRAGLHVFRLSGKAR